MSVTEFQAITFEERDGIGIITMNQPKRRNALSPEMRADFAKLLPSLQFNTGLGAVILKGTEGVFCAGGDLKALAENLGKRDTSLDRQRFYHHHEWFQKLLNLEIPVIAAVDGAAYGAGFSIALSADFILCSDRAKMCCVFPRIGLVPDLGAFFTLPRMVGLQRAKEIMFTGRPLDAQEAKELGIAMEVHGTDDLMDATLELAGRLCKANTRAIGATKRIVNQSFNLDAQALIEMEAAAQAVQLSSDYHQNAIKGFLDKQPLAYDWERMDLEAADKDAAE